MNPHVAKNFTDALVLEFAATYMPMVGRSWHEAEPMGNVQTVCGDSGSGVETHHNSEATPDRVDARSLRDISTVTAAFLYFLARRGGPLRAQLQPMLERLNRFAALQLERIPVESQPSPASTEAGRIVVHPYHCTLPL